MAHWRHSCRPVQQSCRAHSCPVWLLWSLVRTVVLRTTGCTYVPGLLAPGGGPGKRQLRHWRRW